MDPLIISFAPGSSGRFLSTICHFLIQKNDSDPLVWTQENSAHNYEVSLGNSYYENVPDDLLNNKLFCHTESVYQYLKLSPNTVFPTHAFPNFKLIKERVPDCKIIIVGLREASYTEIRFNASTKNKFPANAMNQTRKHNVSNFKKFTTLDIPIEYQYMSNVIMYDEIFQKQNESFVGLEKIKKILQTDIPENVFIGYKSYVQNREILLRENNMWNKT